MSLYSWFVDTKKNAHKINTKQNTMWPIAQIRENTSLITVINKPQSTESIKAALNTVSDKS